MRAREVMSTPVVTVYRDAPLKEIAETMAKHHISGVPVVERDDRLCGIISESDFLTKLEYGTPEEGTRFGLFDRLASTLGATPKLHARTAEELMTDQVVTAGPEVTLRELVHLMTTRAVNRVPIVEGGRVVGIVTRADILKTLARPDEAVSQEVRWSLQHDLWIDPADITVTTRNGIVTLAGMVETRADADLAKRWAATIAGVVDVDAVGLRYRTDDRKVRGFTDLLR
jgi:CBS domain-containing protein